MEFFIPMEGSRELEARAVQRRGMMVNQSDYYNADENELSVEPIILQSPKIYFGAKIMEDNNLRCQTDLRFHVV